MSKSYGLFIILLTTPFFVLAVGANATGPAILYIGDSISNGSFGEVIYNNLKKTGASVTSEASCGTTPISWLNGGGGTAATVCGFRKIDPSGHVEKTGSKQKHDTPNLAAELKRIGEPQARGPQTTIVQLGTNIAVNYPQTVQALINPHKPPPTPAQLQELERELPAIQRHYWPWQEQLAGQMIQEIKSSGSQCIWIGPPPADKNIRKALTPFLQKTNEMLEAVCRKAGCAYIDSLSFIKYSDGANKDGIHPPDSVSATWGEQEFDHLQPYLQGGPMPETMPNGKQVNDQLAGRAATAPQEAAEFGSGSAQGRSAPLPSSGSAATGPVWSGRIN